MVYKKGFKTLEFKIICGIFLFLSIWLHFSSDPALWAWAVFAASAAYVTSRGLFKKNRFDSLNVAHETSELTVTSVGILLLGVGCFLAKGNWDFTILKSVILLGIFIIARGHSKGLTPRGRSY